jgi:hypothetical protein
MKCKYRFRVVGRIRLSANAPVLSRGWLVQFEAANDVLTHISVTVPLQSKQEWPIVTKAPRPGVGAHIDPKAPHLPFIQREMRTLQGLLSMFGLHSIDLNYPTLEWIPESDQERNELQLFGFEQKREEVPDNELRPVSFDLLARAVFASDAATDIDVPLAFFRRGMIDVVERDYIEAIYDFYFVLETLFADGRSKTAAVQESFRNSPALLAAVHEALANPNPMASRKVTAQYRASYGTLSDEEALSKLVNLRGFLHHHSKSRRDSWHPDEQARFAPDALFLQDVAFNVVWSLAEPYLYADDVVKAYEELRLRLKSDK